jgi:hypothetical protein
MPYDDEEVYTRPRRRSRRGREHGSSVGMWVALAGLALVFVVGGVVAVVVSRKGGRDGTAATPGTPGTDDIARVFAGGTGVSAITPGARKITVEEFRAIKKEDTLATLEARFGPAKRFGPAELDRMYLNMINRGHDARLKISFGMRLRETYQIANPECYLWSSGGTSLYVIPAQGNPRANLHLMWYDRQGVNERGEFHGETIEANFLLDQLPPAPPLGK